MRTIHDNYVLFKKETFVKKFMDVMEGKNTSLAILAMRNLTDIHAFHENVHFMKEIVGIYPLALGTWKGFPYLREFNYKIQALVQAGLIDFWSDQAILQTENYYEKSNESDDTTIDMNDIVPAFLLLLIGYFAGFFFLIVEVIFYPSRILT